MQHTTFEVPDPREGQYTDYPLQYGSGDVSRPFHRALGALTHNVILPGGDFSGMKFPEGVVNTRPTNLADGVAAWFLLTGAFNHMNGGENDMLRAAAIMMDQNSRPGHELVRLDDQKTDYVEAMQWLFDNNGPETQKANENTLLTAQLIHKAGWKEPEGERRERLFSMAEQIYSRLYTGKDVTDAHLHYRAGEYLADIKFHRLGVRLRQACRDGDLSAQSRIESNAKLLLEEQIDDLAEMGQLAHSVGSLREHNEWVGLMGEHILMIANRADIFQRTAPHVENIEVRRAFNNEDEPYEPRSSHKTKFDVVVQLFRGDDVFWTLPNQLKVRKDPNAGTTKENSGYEDGIRIRTLAGFTPGSIVKEGERIRQWLRGEAPQPKDDALRLEQNVRQLAEATT